MADVILLRRYIVAGYDVDINESAADVNKDDTMNMEDVVLLRRYIAGGLWRCTEITNKSKKKAARAEKPL